MTTALLALAVLALPAAAALPAATAPTRALAPGFGPAAAAFPSAERLFGDAADPLASLTAPEEDLKDSVAEIPSAAWLQAGLRSPDVSVRLAAIRASARPRGVAAVPHLSGVMLRLDQPARLRVAAALALGAIGDRVAVGALSEALKDPAPEVRYAAALSLGRLPADGVETRLERVLRSDPVWQPRYAAAIALGKTRKAFAAVVLADALAGDPSWQVRQQAARSLQDIGTAHAAAALFPGLRDSEPSVRAAAGAALAEIGGPEGRLVIADALRTETEPSVRAVLGAAMRRARSRP